MASGVATSIKLSKKNILIFSKIFRTKRLFTYEYILNKRVKDLNKEFSKKENDLVPILIIIKKIISYEKIVIPRLKVFKEICPSSFE